MQYRSYNGANDYPRVPRYCTASCDEIQGEDHAITIFNCNICVNFYEKSYKYEYYSSTTASTTEPKLILDYLDSILIDPNNAGSGILRLRGEFMPRNTELFHERGNTNT